MPLLGIFSDLKRAEDTEGTILKAIILISIAITHKLALVRLPVILLKGLRLNLVALRLIVIEFRGSGCLGECYFRVILMVGDYYSALGIILISLK